jgi:hypothetical protein
MADVPSGLSLTPPQGVGGGEEEEEEEEEEGEGEGEGELCLSHGT